MRRWLPLLLLLLPASLIAEEASAPPPLTIAAIQLSPEQPKADTLYRLTVRIENKGKEIASSLGFAVKVNGHELPVYRNHLFLQALPPGESTEVKLYNFWSSETGRPWPNSGQVDVEVTLTESTWHTITMEDDTEVWTPIGPVPGLPQSARRTLSPPATN